MAYDKTLGYDPSKDYSAEINQLQLQKQQTIGGIAGAQGGMTPDQIDTLINQNISERQKKEDAMKAAGTWDPNWAATGTVAGWTGDSSTNAGEYMKGGAANIAGTGNAAVQDYYNPDPNAKTNNPGGGSVYEPLPFVGMQDFSGGGGGGSGGNTDFMSMYNAYNQNVADSLNSNAAWLAGQQSQYDNMFGAYSQQLAAMRDASMQAYRDAILASVEQGRQQYEAQKGVVNQTQDEAARQAYIRMMNNQRDIPQQLAGMGLVGGMTESANVANRANYGNQQNAINMQRNQQLADIANAIIQLANNGQISIAEAQQQIDQLKASDLSNTFGMQLSTDQWLQNLFNDKNNAAYQNNAIGAQLGLGALQAQSGEAYNYAALNQNQNQFDATLDFNKSTQADNLAYNYAALAQGDRQFDASQAQNQAQYDRTQTWNEKLGEMQNQLAYAQIDEQDKIAVMNNAADLLQIGNTFTYQMANIDIAQKTLDAGNYFNQQNLNLDTAKVNQYIKESNSNIDLTKANIASIEVGDKIKEMLANSQISNDALSTYASAAATLITSAEQIADKYGDTSMLNALAAQGYVKINPVKVESAVAANTGSAVAGGIDPNNLEPNVRQVYNAVNSGLIPMGTKSDYDAVIQGLTESDVDPRAINAFAPYLQSLVKDWSK